MVIRSAILGYLLILAASGAGADVDFARDVRPILSENCSFCHGPDRENRQADLRLDTADGAWSVLEKENSADSELYRRLVSDDPDEVMPPPESNRSLSAEQIELIRTWIDQGAPWQQHWSLRPIIAPEVPDGSHPVDALVRKQLEQRNLRPAPEADKRTLIRRITLDLTGLPPTPDEVDAFLNDHDADAYERVVDRLLASPAYGQRMAWDWLDAARYADTNGYQGDRERTMWPWRDWVVRAFNDNLPFDQFTIWQLAGDLLPNPTQDQVLATAFLRNHMINGEGGRIAEENRVEYVFDMTETVGTVWLGLTLNCCRCHDHKYDPLTNQEYYQLFAFFNQSPIDGSGGDPQTEPVLQIETAELRQRREALRDKQRAYASELREHQRRLLDQRQHWEASELERLRMLRLEADSESSLDEDDQQALDALQIPAAERNESQSELIVAAHRQSDQAYSELRKKHDAVEREIESVTKHHPRVMVMRDREQPRETFVLTRGVYRERGEMVTPGLPACLPATPATDRPLNRLDLAQWLVDPSNPLTARVVVNRFWQQVFGMGLVKTAEDFGTQGETPIHAELLDWLADHFQATHWDVKALMRLIVTSQTYRQSSQITDSAAYESDPENRCLSRGSRYRLPAWMIRDSALAASGLLSEVAGGPAVNTYQPPGIWEEASFGKKVFQRDSGEKLYRRSLYVFWRRIIAPPLFFDNSKRQTCSVKPSRTNTPLQAIQLLNNVTYVEAARALAQRVLLADLDSDRQRLDAAMQFVLSRVTTDRERDRLIQGLQRTRRQYQAQPAEATNLLAVGESPRDEMLDAIEHASWTNLCLAILNLDEAVTRQ